MRSFMRFLDQLSAWALVVGAAVVLGAFEALGALARIRLNPGLLDFSHTALFAGTIVLVLSAIRRRQTPALGAAAQVLAALAGANLVALAMFWLAVRRVTAIPLPVVLVDGLRSGVLTIASGLPFALLMLWLSRRYGSHSTVTERRLRVVREVLSRKRRAPPAPVAPASRDGH